MIFSLNMNLIKRKVTTTHQFSLPFFLAYFLFYFLLYYLANFRAFLAFSYSNTVQKVMYSAEENAMQKMM